MLKISELARKSGLADSTARRYVEQFKEYFPSKQEGRTRLYSDDGVDTLKEIARLFSQGLNVDQVRSQLMQEHSQTIEAEETALTLTLRERELQSREALAQALQSLADQKEKLLELDRTDKALAEKNQKLEQEISGLRDRLDKLEEEQKQQQISWWSRLLGKKRKGG